MDVEQDFGLVGLAVMGENLVMNIARHGFSVAVYNRTAERTQAFIQDRAKGMPVKATYTVEALVDSVVRPRRIMLMVKAGPAVDAVIEQLMPYLDKGDLIIDGGNSHYTDSERRARQLEQDGIMFLGTGVSGGEEGALWGPSIMPGGQPEAYALVRPIFEAIAAQYKGQPCVTYLGPRGAGHFVKMVHNGIEYGDMQLIAEAYHLLRQGLGLSAAELHEVFAEWNKGELSSYLIEITADIFTRIDAEVSKPLVDLILDTAAQKGTGKWTSQIALDIGAPIPTINAAVEGRIISALKKERVAAAKELQGPHGTYQGNRQQFVEHIRAALYCSKICSYAQGMAMLNMASQEFGYDLRLGDIARIWRAGCIIRAEFLDEIAAAFDRNPHLANLLFDERFKADIAARQDGWRFAVKTAVEMGVPTLAMSGSLAYYDSYRSERLPANLIQAQRDYFGAHTYERLDRKGSFHTEWATRDEA
ncbi:MAG: NADP-dependent phosphogluconate dehydrogenase [Chloroflexi bacterium]|nr:NADP-dependent phosphogluconate dehydrogenase [Chloroflexota bacterium]